MLEKTPESLLDIKKIKPVDIMGNQPWILVQRTDVEAETPIFWSSDGKSWLIGKVPDAGKDWGQKEKRASRGWDGWLDGITNAMDMSLGKLQEMQQRDNFNIGSKTEKLKNIQVYLQMILNFKSVRAKSNQNSSQLELDLKI